MEQPPAAKRPGHEIGQSGEVSGRREREIGSNRELGGPVAMGMAVRAAGLAGPGAGPERLVDDALDGARATAAFGAATVGTAAGRAAAIRTVGAEPVAQAPAPPLLLLSEPDADVAAVGRPAPLGTPLLGDEHAIDGQGHAGENQDRYPVAPRF